MEPVEPGNTYFDGGIWQQIETGDPELFASALALNPTGRMATPEEIARGVVFLASPASSSGERAGALLIVLGAGYFALRVVAAVRARRRKHDYDRKTQRYTRRSSVVSARVAPETPTPAADGAADETAPTLLGDMELFRAHDVAAQLREYRLGTLLPLVSTWRRLARRLCCRRAPERDEDIDDGALKGHEEAVRESLRRVDDECAAKFRDVQREVEGAHPSSLDALWMGGRRGDGAGDGVGRRRRGAMMRSRAFRFVS